MSKMNMERIIRDDAYFKAVTRSLHSKENEKSLFVYFVCFSVIVLW